jgi:hypothetical protein
MGQAMNEIGLGMKWAYPSLNKIVTLTLGQATMKSLGEK